MDSFKTHLNEGVVSALVAVSFITKLTTSFEKWDAFKKGIIDKNGKIIKKNTKLPIFDNIARKIKILFHKFLPGKKKYIALLLSMYLIKTEDVDDPYNNLIKEELDHQLTDKEKNSLMGILNEVTNTSKGVGKYSGKFFIGKNLTKKAQKKAIKKLKSDYRNYSYDPETGNFIFI